MAISKSVFHSQILRIFVFTIFFILPKYEDLRSNDLVGFEERFLTGVITLSFKKKQDKY